MLEHQDVLISCCCGYRGAIADRRFSCPVCKVADVEVTAGEEMILQQLEMETEE